MSTQGNFNLDEFTEDEKSIFHGLASDNEKNTYYKARMNEKRSRGSDSENRTGTSISGNTAGQSFKATAEQQQVDRDKNAEG